MENKIDILRFPPLSSCIVVKKRGQLLSTISFIQSSFIHIDRAARKNPDCMTTVVPFLGQQENGRPQTISSSL